MAVASLYDKGTRSYCHGLSDRFGAAAVDTALRDLHLELFVNWLNLSLRRQLADLSIYRTATKRNALAVGEFDRVQKEALPPGATQPERQLFLLDMSLLREGS